MKRAHLKLENTTCVVEIDDRVLAASLLYDALPLEGEARNIGGEIFFRTDGLDIPFVGSEKEEFKIGDVVYWRSPSGERKFAIAFFYGNTKFGSWKTPRAASPCIRVGKIISALSEIENIESGRKIRFEQNGGKSLVAQDGS